jgi:hypothetical protein
LRPRNCMVAIARLSPGPENEQKFFGSFFQERTETDERSRPTPVSGIIG